MTKEVLCIGGTRVSLSQAEDWVQSYFDADGNKTSSKPYAYPAYDELATGSHTDELNDGDLLAPTLLTPRPRSRRSTPCNLHVSNWRQDLGRHQRA